VLDVVPERRLAVLETCKTDTFGEPRGPRRGRSAGPDDYAGTKALMIGEPKGDALSEAMQSWQLGWGNQLHGVLTQEFESRRKRKHAFLEAVWHNKRIPLVGAAEEIQAAQS
jgi:hypothetical protein